jgi:hypothetical protein
MAVDAAGVGDEQQHFGPVIRRGRESLEAGSGGKRRKKSAPLARDATVTRSCRPQPHSLALAQVAAVAAAREVSSEL